MPTYHLACPFCGGDDLTPFPDPTSAWSCLGCQRVVRVEVAMPAAASPTGWGSLRVVGAAAVAA